MLWWLIPGLVTVEIAIVMLDALVTELGWVSIGAARRLFNITREDGVANFFSSFQMLAVAAVLLLVTLVIRGQNQGSRPKLVWGWALITALFFYMGVDDATKLHERMGTIFSELVTGSEGRTDPGLLGQLYDVFPSYTWQLVLGPVVAIAGLFVFVFLMRELPSLHLKLLVCLALGLFVIAVGMDFVEGMENGIMIHVADVFSTFPGRAVHFSKSIEEFLEMAGTTIFLFVFLKTLAHTTPSITFELNHQE
jgi:hypothetical protein